MYAHSHRDLPEGEWEPLADHLRAVERRTAAFAADFQADDWARAAGLLHDLGKAKAAFQDYLRHRCPSEPHSGEGARFAAEHFPGPVGKMLAFCIAGHHAGLANGLRRAENAVPATPLSERLEQAAPMTLPQGIALPDPRQMVPAPLRALKSSKESLFAIQFFVRMLFSALVDADFLETEGWYDRIKGRASPRGWHGTLEDLRAALDETLARFRADTPVNKLRAEILAHARGMAHRAPGAFTLTVPTGGGKTLTSLAFALDHAIKHGLQRIIYVIPYTSIIEQTAAVFRRALADADAVLEHHTAFDWDGVRDPGESEKLRLAAQNWDRPIIVTTAVQFFESLYANRPSRCRKLHNIARSVIILDEAHTLPGRLLRPCLAAVRELMRGYGCSVVFCTATQPALLKGAKGDGFPAAEGLDPAAVRELAPRPERLYRAFRRTRIHNAGALDDEALLERLSAHPSALVILNNRRHVRDLFERLRAADAGCTDAAAGALFMMTTYMTPNHRRHVLEQVRCALQEGRPVRLIATSLVEAGVDVDFPVVWREMAGLDSIAQAAGRCNREGRLPVGEVFVFSHEGDYRPPEELRQLARIGTQVLEEYAEDPLSIAAVKAYFRKVYWTHGTRHLDAGNILERIEKSGNQLNFPFADLAHDFRFIRDDSLPLIITGGRWGVPDDKLKDLRDTPHAGSIARQFQQYQIQVPQRLRRQLMDDGLAAPWQTAKFGEQFVLLTDSTLYDEDAGFDDPTTSTEDRFLI